jgi:hypothetical protein
VRSLLGMLTPVVRVSTRSYVTSTTRSGIAARACVVGVRHKASAAGTDDDDHELPKHLRAPAAPLSADEREKVQKTAAFLKTCCTALYLQDTLDLITAAVTHQTLRDHHILAMIRHWKNAEMGRCDEGTETSKSALCPQRRCLSVLQLLLEQCYVTPTAVTSPQSASTPACGVSPAVFTSGLLWFMAPVIRRVKEQHREDKEVEGHDDDVLASPTKEMVISSADIWQLVATMELHNVRITSELVLDGLMVLMTLDDAAWRRSHSGQPLAEETRKNRIEFIDAERNALRERLSHERILARRSAPQARREYKFSEVTPPEQ